MRQDIKHSVVTFLSAPGNEKLTLDKAFKKFCEDFGDTRKPAFKTYFDLVKSGQLTLADLRPSSASSMPKINLKDIKIQHFTPGKAKIDKTLFEPYKTGKGIDILLSKRGGVMRATTIVVTSAAGTGKSTVCYDMAAQIQINHPKAKVACLQAEMKSDDLEFELHENSKKWMGKVEFIIFKNMIKEYGKHNADVILQKIFEAGYHVLIIDSIEEIISQLEICCEMTSGEAEDFVLKLCDDANESSAKTAIIAIQQQTKGGVFKGSNKISHNTTAMLYLHKDDKGDRYAVFKGKNRRCGEHVGKKMYYSLDAKGEVVWDLVGFTESEDRSKLVKDEKKKLQDGSKDFVNIFEKKNEFEADRASAGMNENDESEEFAGAELLDEEE